MTAMLVDTVSYFVGGYIMVLFSAIPEQLKSTYDWLESPKHFYGEKTFISFIIMVILGLQK